MTAATKKRSGAGRRGRADRSALHGGRASARSASPGAWGVRARHVAAGPDPPQTGHRPAARSHPPVARARCRRTRRYVAPGPRGLRRAAPPHESAPPPVLAASGQPRLSDERRSERPSSRFRCAVPTDGADVARAPHDKAMRSFGAMLTRRLAADQRISYKKMHLFGGICKNPHKLTLPLVVRSVLSKPLATAGDERGQEWSWSQLTHPMVGAIPTPHGV